MSDSPLDDNDLAVSPVGQLSAENVLQAVGRGTMETNRNRWSEHPYDAAFPFCEGVFYTRDGACYAWASTSAMRMRVSAPQADGLLVLGEPLVPKQVILLPDLLTPPGADQVLAAHPFHDNPVSFSGDYQIVTSEAPSKELQRVLCYFLEHGRRRTRVGRKPPYGQFWRNGGSLCTKAGVILFFDFWTTDTVFLQNDKGACCLVVCSPPDLSKLMEPQRRAKEWMSRRRRDRTQ